MKTLLPLFFLCVYNLAQAQTWIQLEDFPATERDDGTSFLINNITYCGAGLAPWFAPLGDFHAFDCITNSWSNCASLPANKERQYAVGFSHYGLGYVFGGSNGSNLNDLWEYSPSNDSWTEKTALPSTGITGACGFVIADTAYIIGGKDENGNTLSTVWAYDFNADSWSQKNDLPAHLWRASAVANNNFGYLLFGKDENNLSNSTLYLYTPTTDSWSNVSIFPTSGRYYSTLQTINNFLVTGFGIDDLGTYYNDLWSFDLVSNTWVSLPSTGISARKGGMSFTFNETIYYTTGITATNDRQKDTWKYSPVLALNTIQNEQISIYPNPTQNSIQVKLETEIQSLEIYSVSGEQLLKTSNESSIDLSSLANGIYQLIIHTEKGSYSKRIEVFR